MRYETNNGKLHAVLAALLASGLPLFVSYFTYYLHPCLTCGTNSQSNICSTYKPFESLMWLKLCMLHIQEKKIINTGKRAVPKRLSAISEFHIAIVEMYVACEGVERERGRRFLRWTFARRMRENKALSIMENFRQTPILILNITMRTCSGTTKQG